MFHHYSGPDFSFPHGDARVDLCDLFASPKPGDATKTILIMDAHPSVGFNPLGPTATEPFAPEAIYELKVDTNGDAVADVAYRVRFSSSPDGTQTATVRRVEGTNAAAPGDGGETIIENAPVSTGQDAQVTGAGEYRFFAGWRSDPFFFDAAGLLNNFQSTGDDFFGDKNVCSIVLELPTTALGSTSRVGLWHRTLIPANGAGGQWVQVDRGARPQLETILLPNELKADYLAAEPANDSQFVAGIAHALDHTGGYTPDEARRVAETLLPDILPYEPSQGVAYPDNGRTLTDDPVDILFAVMTNGKITEDKAGPHADPLSEFPYVGPPHPPNPDQGVLAASPIHHRCITRVIKDSALSVCTPQVR